MVSGKIGKSRQNQIELWAETLGPPDYNEEFKGNRQYSIKKYSIKKKGRE
jgi:hypothetical protein